MTPLFSIHQFLPALLGVEFCDTNPTLEGCHVSKKVSSSGNTGAQIISHDDALSSTSTSWYVTVHGISPGSSSCAVFNQVICMHTCVFELWSHTHVFNYMCDKYAYVSISAIDIHNFLFFQLISRFRPSWINCLQY